METKKTEDMTIELSAEQFNIICRALNYAAATHTADKFADDCYELHNHFLDIKYNQKLIN